MAADGCHIVLQFNIYRSFTDLDEILIISANPLENTLQQLDQFVQFPLLFTALICT